MSHQLINNHCFIDVRNGEALIVSIWSCTSSRWSKTIITEAGFADLASLHEILGRHIPQTKSPVKSSHNSSESHGDGGFLSLLYQINTILLFLEFQ